MREYALIVLNVFDAAHSIRSLYKLLNSYQYRHIQNTVNHLRWTVLQKRTMPGCKCEFFQGRGGGGFVGIGHFDKHFVENTRKRGPARKHFEIFSPRFS